MNRILPSLALLLSSVLAGFTYNRSRVTLLKQREQVAVAQALYSQMRRDLNRDYGTGTDYSVEFATGGPLNESMRAFLDGTPGRAIILGLNGYHDHWTVISHITSKSIFLYDSAKISPLHRSECTTAKRCRKHLLLPAQTYFLSKN